MIKTLRFKFILTAMASLVAVLALIICLINITSYQKIKKDADKMLDMLLDNGGSFPGFEHNANPKPLPSDRFMTPETPFETRFFSVSFNSNGDITKVDTSRIAAVNNAEASELARELYNNGNHEGAFDSYKYSSKTKNGDTIYIFLDIGKNLTTFRNFLLRSILVSAFGALAVFLLVFYSSKIIFRPIEESYSKQKAFITNASHDIKTPLTIIAADAEIIEMENGESQWSRDIKTQIERLSSLTDKLVFLSRMEEENYKLTLLEFSLSDLVSELTDEYLAPLAAADKAIVTNIANGIECRLDEGMIRRLLYILLDNALKYSKKGTSVRVSLVPRIRHIELTVENECEGITAGDHDELFERFTRLDKARSTTPGHGIGLSVAKAIVSAHKGRIKASSAVDGIFTLTVNLPT